MPKVSESYLETRRQQVLGAAYSCFARNGFHQTTMQDIADEAGVSYGVVYHYFDSKEDVIEETWQASREAREVRYQEAQEKATIPEVLAEFLEASLRRLEQPESIPEMRLRIQLFGEALLNPRIGAKFRDVWNDVMELLEDAIHQGQERGEISLDVDTRALARAYLAVHDGLLLQKAVDPEVDIEKMVEVFWQMHQNALWNAQEREAEGDGNAKG